MSDENTLHVEIVSPEKPLFSGAATSVVAPAHDGEVGILPKHAPMLAQLGVGEVRVTNKTLGGDHTEYFAVHGGFIETSSNKVIILTEDARAPDDVDADAIQREIKELQDSLAKQMPPEERLDLEAKLGWLRSQDRLASRAAKA